MLIKELVRIDEHGAFRSDVQLSDFENPELNKQLLRNYIFTDRAPDNNNAGRDASAKDVLDILKSAFTLERYENRIVLIANYGRGKSHLALTLANFFSRPTESDEVRIIFERLRQALNNPAALSGYRDFKQSKGEFLVIRLRGDGFDDLHEGFLRALEQALDEHDCTRGIELSLWHARAEAWLDNLSGEARQKAEVFLAGHNTDLSSLRQDLRKSGAYELVRETFKHLTGAYPDFGREISLKDLVIWAVDEVCVPNKMGGLLVLFDEFSLFLQKYAASRAAGKLQDLLNGISDRQGKSAFLAFAQIELESVLETYAQGTRRDDIRRELDRLPRDKRARLFSLMEGVLNSYLKQDEAAWQAWLQHQPVRAAMVRNREMLTDYFSQRYDNILRWGDEQKLQTVVKGCFPLHSLTTAILSNHTFEAGTGENARTALHFVRDRWEKGLPERSAERNDGEPNFVFAVELVDFFGEQIHKRWYEAYRAALENARLPLNEEHHAALKALLLQQAVSGLNRQTANGYDQLQLLSALSGLPETRLKDILRELSDNRVIEFDRYSRFYSLFPAGVRSPETVKIIEEAVQKIPVDRVLLDKIAESIPRLEVKQNFGAADDWVPKQVILTEEFFTPETIKTLLSPYRAGMAGIEEGARGLVIWLLAKTEEEKMRLRQNAQKILDNALVANPHPSPVIVVLPSQAYPGLLESARRRKALETLGRNEREKIGSIGYENETGHAKNEFDRNFKNFLDPDRYADLPRKLHEYALPGIYRAVIETTNNTALRNVVSTIYHRAYPYRIEFYTQYAVGGRGPNRLREAVRKVARGLFSDEVAGSLPTLRQQDIQAQITINYLSVRWGLLSAETYKVQPPTLPALRESWNRLEDTFSPGCKEIRVRDVLLELLNPPYGHDYNTLTILLASWIGYRRHEIRISLSGQLISLDKFKNYFDETQSPKDFLDQLIVTSPLAISRINANEMFAEVDSILEQIRQNQPFSLSQAEQALAKLAQAQSNPGLSPECKTDIETYSPRLQEAISKAQTYDEQIVSWRKELGNADFDKLFTLRAQIGKFAPTTLVSPSQPPTEVLLKDWESRLERETETYCCRYAQLNELSEYKAHETQLNKALDRLKEYPALRSMAENALKNLQARRDELKQAEEEKPILAEINGMAVSAGLADLYQYREKLKTFRALSPQAEEVRRKKTEQIDNRIQQFEQLVQALAQVAENADSLQVVRDQKELLLRNLEQTQGTPLYQTLVNLQQSLEKLEEFFERLQALSVSSKHAPEELASIETKIAAAEIEFSDWLSPARVRLLGQKKQEVENLRQQKIKEAHQWLTDLASRYRSGEKPDELLHRAQNPPHFLSAEDQSHLEQLRRVLQKKIDQDHLLKIESLFKELDRQTQRECLERLKALVDKL